MSKASDIKDAKKLELERFKNKLILRSNSFGINFDHNCVKEKRRGMTMEELKRDKIIKEVLEMFRDNNCMPFEDDEAESLRVPNIEGLIDAIRLNSKLTLYEIKRALGLLK